MSEYFNLSQFELDEETPPKIHDLLNKYFNKFEFINLNESILNNISIQERSEIIKDKTNYESIMEILKKVNKLISIVNQPDLIHDVKEYFRKEEDNLRENKKTPLLFQDGVSFLGDYSNNKVDGEVIKKLEKGYFNTNDSSEINNKSFFGSFDDNNKFKTGILLKGKELYDGAFVNDDNKIREFKGLYIPDSSLHNNQDKNTLLFFNGKMNEFKGDNKDSKESKGFPLEKKTSTSTNTNTNLFGNSNSIFNNNSNKDNANPSPFNKDNNLFSKPQESSNNSKSLFEFGKTSTNTSSTSSMFGNIQPSSNISTNNSTLNNPFGAPSFSGTNLFSVGKNDTNQKANSGSNSIFGQNKEDKKVETLEKVESDLVQKDNFKQLDIECSGIFCFIYDDKTSNIKINLCLGKMQNNLYVDDNRLTFSYLLDPNNGRYEKLSIFKENFINNKLTNSECIKQDKYLVEMSNNNQFKANGLSYKTILSTVAR